MTEAAPVSLLASRKEAFVSRRRGASEVRRLSLKEPRKAVNPGRSGLKMRFPRTSVTLSGTDAILNLSITRQGSYTTGTRNLYLWLTDSAANNSGWLQ